MSGRRARERLALGTLLLALSAIAALASRPSYALVAYAVATFVHGVVLVTCRCSADARTFVLVAALGLVFVDPIFSDDVYRYAWDGKVLAHGLSPYAAPPADPSLASLRDDAWTHINHPRIATIYPPLAVLAFALTSPLGIHGPKLVAALALVLLVELVRRAEVRGHAPPRAALVVATSPTLLVESAVEGHVEVVAITGFVAALFALRRNDVVRATVAAALASCAKLAGVLLVPMLFVRSRRAALVAALAFVLALAPLVESGGSANTAGLSHYTRRWGGGSVGYALLEATTGRVLEACCGTSGHRIRVPLPEPLLERVRGTPLDPHRAIDEERPDPVRGPSVHRSIVVPFVARAVLAVGLALLLVALANSARRDDEVVAAMRTFFLVALFVVPRALPWYFAWLVPLDAITGRRAGLVVAATALLGHAGSAPWQRARIGFEPRVELVVGALVALTALAIESRLSGPADADRARAAPSDDR